MTAFSAITPFWQVRDRNQDKKTHEQQVTAMRSVISRDTVTFPSNSSDAKRSFVRGSYSHAHQFVQGWRKREIEPKVQASSLPGSELEVRYAQLEKRQNILEASLEDERRINKELEADLQDAVHEGIKYRDHLARMLDIREKDTKAQENLKYRQEQDESRQNAALLASLREAEKAVEFERSEALRLQNGLAAYETKVSSQSAPNVSSARHAISDFRNAGEG